MKNLSTISYLYNLKIVVYYQFRLTFSKCKTENNNGNKFAIVFHVIVLFLNYQKY